MMIVINVLRLGVIRVGGLLQINAVAVLTKMEIQNQPKHHRKAVRNIA